MTFPSSSTGLQPYSVRPISRSRMPPGSSHEVTDAAQGQRAECVMLNKGPFIIDTIAALSSILGRMSGHVIKKTDLLRKLNAWDEFVSE